MRHELKILAEYYKPLVSGEKTNEVRKNDRNFQIGDIITFNVLLENGLSTKGFITYKITHVLDFEEGLKEGYVVLSIKEEKS